MRRGIRSRAEEVRAYWAMILPAFILYMLVFAFPIVLSILLSLSNYNGGKLFGGEAWQLMGFQQYRETHQGPPVLAGAEEQRVHRARLGVRPTPAGIHLRVSHLPKDREVRRLLAGRPLHARHHLHHRPRHHVERHLLPDWSDRRHLQQELHGGLRRRHLDAIFKQAGGFNITDEVVKKILAVEGPQVTDRFSSNPVADLKALLLGYQPSSDPVILSEMTNSCARKWTPDFLAKQDVAMLPIMFVTLWCWTGMYLILFLANMQKIDPQLLEAARIDGAGEGQVMGRIVLPPSLGRDRQLRHPLHLRVAEQLRTHMGHDRRRAGTGHGAAFHLHV